MRTFFSIAIFFLVNIHNNPVEAGFVNEAHEWRLSSANEQSPIKIDEDIKAELI